MTLETLFIGLVIWLAFLLVCLVGAWVKLGRRYDDRTVQVLPVATVLICVSLILFFVLRAVFHV
jgi:O-antigen ligase